MKVARAVTFREQNGESASRIAVKRPRGFVLHGPSTDMEERRRHRNLMGRQEGEDVAFLRGGLSSMSRGYGQEEDLKGWKEGGRGACEADAEQGATEPARCDGGASFPGAESEGPWKARRRSSRGKVRMVVAALWAACFLGPGAAGGAGLPSASSFSSMQRTESYHVLNPTTSSVPLDQVHVLLPQPPRSYPRSLRRGGEVFIPRVLP